MKVEGYWWSSDPANKDYPKAEPAVGAIPQKGQFLSKLRIMQEEAREVAYRGFSTCRLCGARNGHQEYELSGWRWPEGYIHYVQDHNVPPSSKFRRFVEDFLLDVLDGEDDESSDDSEGY